MRIFFSGSPFLSRPVVYVAWFCRVFKGGDLPSSLLGFLRRLSMLQAKRFGPFSQQANTPSKKIQPPPQTCSEPSTGREVQQIAPLPPNPGLQCARPRHDQK